MKKSKVFEVYQSEKGKPRLYTKALTKKPLLTERTTEEDGTTYREFDPAHSKLAAAIAKGAPNVGIRNGDIVLYLGASHGYTSSFVSDMVGEKGLVFALDFAPRVIRDLYFVCEQRKNMVPMMEDANHPEEYKNKVTEVDVVFQDIAQKNQVQIFLRNLQFLKKGGYAMLALKARSIDVTKKPKTIFKEVHKELEKHVKIIDTRLLDPFEKDHMWFLCKN